MDCSLSLLAFEEAKVARPPSARVRPRKTPLQRRSREMLETILQAATRVLIREGYTRATTNRVAAAAGISVGSLYQYFPSKDALVVALLRRHREDMVRVLASHLDRLSETTPVETVVRALVRAILEAHGVNPRLHRVMIEEVLRKDARAEVGDFEPRVEQLLVTALHGYRDRLRIRNIDLAAFILVRMMLGVAHAAVVDHPERARDPRLADELGDIVLRYLVE
jgi:AcrR family transcriptional regulator